VTDVPPGRADPHGALSHTSSDAGDQFTPDFPCLHLSGSAGSASCQFTFKPTIVGDGQHTITISYGGDSAHFGSSGQTIIAVTGRATRTTIACQQTALALGQSTVCVATVTDTAPGDTRTPGGKVTFGGGADSFLGSPCTLSGATGTASCQVSYSPTAVGTGSHTITATYLGEPQHTPSSGSTTITVTP
jgi:hypothetical protein